MVKKSTCGQLEWYRGRAGSILTNIWTIIGPMLQQLYQLLVVSLPISQFEAKGQEYILMTSFMGHRGYQWDFEFVGYGMRDFLPTDNLDKAILIFIMCVLDKTLGDYHQFYRDVSSVFHIYQKVTQWSV